MIGYVFMFVMGIVLGFLGADYLKSVLKLEDFRQTKAITDSFSCRRNEFSMFSEGIEDFYIVSIKDREYQIKFSSNLPRKVVYKQEVFPESFSYETEE